MHLKLLCLVIAVTFLFRSAKPQNCALPHIVSLIADCDLKTECSESGKILATLPTKNVLGVLNVTQTVSNFIDIRVERDIIRLVVKDPLYPVLEREINSTQPGKTYIDESWSDGVELQAEFNCTDGRHKSTTFIIPIYDRNTQPPFFQKSSYTLNMGPCYNGTHSVTPDNKACPLNFETPIVVYDADRDSRNAEMAFNVSENVSELIKINYTELKIYSDNKAEGRSNHHQQNVYLYLVESEKFSTNHTLEFDLSACNIEHAGNSDLNYCADTRVTINFGSVEEFPNILQPPEFKHKVYHATVSSWEDTTPGSELVVEPNIALLLPSYTIPLGSLGYGDGGNGESKMDVEFLINTDMLSIDPYTWKITFNQTVYDSLEFWDSAVHSYQITVRKVSHPILRSSVPLVVFFNFDNGNTTEPTPCSTTTSSPSPECPTVCPPTETTTDHYETTYFTDNPDTTPWYNTTETPEPTENPESSEEQPDPTETPEPEPTENPESSEEQPDPTETPEPEPTENPESSEEQPDPTETPEPEPTIPDSSTPIPTTPEESTTPDFISTTPVKDDECCHKCDLVRDFQCPTGDFDRRMLFADPHNCKVFHQCVDDGNGGSHAVNQTCPNTTIFCPEKQACTFLYECNCNRILDHEECNGTMPASCDSCQECLDPHHPNNLCSNITGTSGRVADPKYCEVFHECDDPGRDGNLRDCTRVCPKGTVFCPNAVTETPTDCVPTGTEHCSCEGKIPYKCELCESFIVWSPVKSRI